MGAFLGKIGEDMGEGGAAAGSDPEAWSGAGERPGQGYHPNPSKPSGTGAGGGTIPNPPPPPKPPTVPKYNAPAFYAPKQSQLQSATYNPSSTSHNYLARYGAGSHI